ncbi:PREDICTED: uncharacterized protein LOC105970190 [Erythranthe guttata]|uniref:uncharacterized protein LOC105970190 n=1 Tax=Erythranthe guttata TaxID=4155 RepID=UPI00064DE985|nr:PREDICTED: uncharacterized protein LOC105970190 [Erythranthe guttata]|eukprot:XP_012850446.1 PREDICTED: uncharacterized protein LOC105970190 [Erythranthe guttata]
MRIDPLMPFVESGSSTEEGERAEPYTGIGTPEQRAIAEDLERVYEECINDGKDQSTADSIACERVLGKTKLLGIQSSTTKKVARSRFSSVRNEELETKVELLEGELQESRDEVSSLKESLNSLLNTLRQKGIVDQPVSKAPNSGTSNDDEERLNSD